MESITKRDSSNLPQFISQKVGRGCGGKAYDITTLVCHISAHKSVSHISAHKSAPVNVTKALLEVEIYLHLSLNSTMDGGQWSALPLTLLTIDQIPIKYNG